MFGSLGPTELIIALVIILLLFGAKKVPELARGLGSGVREFRAGTREGQLEDKKKEEQRKKDEAELDADSAEPPSNVDDTSEQDVTAEADRAEQNQR